MLVPQHHRLLNYFYISAHKCWSYYQTGHDTHKHNKPTKLDRLTISMLFEMWTFQSVDKSHICSSPSLLLNYNFSNFFLLRSLTVSVGIQKVLNFEIKSTWADGRTMRPRFCFFSPNEETTLRQKENLTQKLSLINWSVVINGYSSIWFNWKWKRKIRLQFKKLIWICSCVRSVTLLFWVIADIMSWKTANRINRKLTYYNDFVLVSRR